MAEITLNGKTYPLRDALREFTVPQYPPIAANDAVKRRSVNVPVDHWVTRTLKGGIGLARSNFDDPKDLTRFLDSTAETRFESAITLALLNQPTTAGTPAGSDTIEQLPIVVEHNGNFLGYWAGDTPGNDGQVGFIGVKNWTSDAWGEVANRLENDDSSTGGNPSPGDDIAYPLDAISVGLNVVVAYVGDTTGSVSNPSRDISLANSSSGTGAYTQRATFASYLANVAVAGESQDLCKLAVLNNIVYALLWDETNGQIEFSSSSDDGGSWGGAAVLLSDGSGVKSAIGGFPDRNDDAGVVFGTQHGVYILDVSASTISQILAMPRNSNNCRAMMIWAGDLYVSAGDGAIWRIGYQGFGVYTTQQVGPDRDNGLVARRQGHATYMCASTNWLFMAYGGHAAGLQASVYAFDGEGWHHMYEEGDANQEIDWMCVSAAPDDLVRLHIGIRTSSIATESIFLQEPLADPTSGVVIPTQVTGYVELPVFDGGDPHEQKSFYRARISGEGFGTTSEDYLYVNYGVDGATRTDSTLGDITGSALNADFGGGLGQSMKTLGVRLNLVRDAASNADTPKLFEFEVLYEIWQTQLRGFEADIDIMAAETPMQAITQTIANLRSAINSVPLVSFHYDTASKNTPLNVKVISLSGIEEIERRLARRQMDASEGIPTLTVRVEQRIPA